MIYFALFLFYLVVCPCHIRHQWLHAALRKNGARVFAERHCRDSAGEAPVGSLLYLDATAGDWETRAKR